MCPAPSPCSRLTLALTLLLLAPAVQARQAPTTGVPKRFWGQTPSGLLRKAADGPGYVVRDRHFRPGAPLGHVRGLLKRLPPDCRIGVRVQGGSFYFQPVGWILDHVPADKQPTLMDARVYLPREKLVQAAAARLARGRGKRLLKARIFFSGERSIEHYYRPQELAKVGHERALIGVQVVQVPTRKAALRALAGARPDEVVQARLQRVTRIPGWPGWAEQQQGYYRVEDLRKLLKQSTLLALPTVRRLEGPGEPGAARLAPYRKNRRSLWGRRGSGPRPAAVGQGTTLGDCWLLATVAAVARANPDYVKRMIRKQDDGSYKVRLFVHTNSGELAPSWVRVSDRTPRLAGLWSHYAKSGHRGKWVSLIEKAAAKVAGSYAALDAGSKQRAQLDAFELLVGQRATWHRTKDLSGTRALQLIGGALKRGQPVTAASKDEGWFRMLRRGVVGHHAYAVSGVDLEHGTVALQNPWGFFHVKRLPVARFLESYDSLRIGAAPGY